MQNPFEVITCRLDEIQAALSEIKATTAQRWQDGSPPEAGQLITKQQAARLLACCTSTIDNHARAGRIKRHYIGKGERKIVRFERSQVLALADIKTANND